MSDCMSRPVGLYEESLDEDEWDVILSGINENDHIPKIPPKNVTQHIYNYGEVRVVFPYKAYPSQEQMMEKIIYGARVGQNCLLESPTGTGMTQFAQ